MQQSVWRRAAGLMVAVFLTCGLTVGSAAAQAKTQKTSRVHASQTLVTSYQLVLKAGGRCLESPLHSDPTDAVFQWPCHAGSHQQWYLEYASDGYYLIRSLYDGNCLDVVGGAENGAPVIAWSGGCHGATNQQWRLAYRGNGYYEVVARHSAKCLDMPPGGSGTYADQWQCHGGDNQLWSLR
ncbi:RICIN domain-containing protein [Streptomyces sp. NPDC060006]|uniref:RICIN domain-containing protein n=1 Tax=unclassified Streptomyces TaxID=2593676 RepID=UPI00367CB2C7